MENGSTETRRASRAWRYAPLVLWMAFIFFASSGEFSAANTSPLARSFFLWLFPNLDEESLGHLLLITRKTAHFIEYAILGLLAGRAFVTSQRRTLQRLWFWIALLLIVIYALLDEYHQSFVPSRTASIYDSAIDVVGGLTALLVLYYWLRRARRKPAFRRSQE